MFLFQNFQGKDGYGKNIKVLQSYPYLNPQKMGIYYFYNKKDYADVIKFKDCYEEIIPGYPGETILFTDS